MIGNDHELTVMRERVAKVEGLLEALRKTGRMARAEFGLSPGN